MFLTEGEQSHSPSVLSQPPEYEGADGIGGTKAYHRVSHKVYAQGTGHVVLQECSTQVIWKPLPFQWARMFQRSSIGWHEQYVSQNDLVQFSYVFQIVFTNNEL